jgi:hypothetical protein
MFLFFRIHCSAARNTNSNKRDEPAHSPADRDHFAIRSVIVSEIVLFRLSFHNAEENILELRISSTRAQWLHYVEF